MRVTLDLDLPAPLHAELEAAARECRVAPALFAAEAIESVIASRRLTAVKRGPHGARIGTAEIEDMEEEWQR